MGLFRFFWEAGKYVEPDEAVSEESGPDAPRQIAFHRRVVVVSVLFGLLGAACGVGMILLALAENEGDGGGAEFLLAPLLFGAAGLLFGAAVACALAPRSFLTGPAGRKWMQLIGTQNVLVARIVCFLLALIIGGVPTALGVFILIQEM